MDSVRKAAEMVIEEVGQRSQDVRAAFGRQGLIFDLTCVSVSPTQCQHQFRNRRWNCSTTPRGINVFGRVMNQGILPSGIRVHRHLQCLETHAYLNFYIFSFQCRDA